MNHKTLCIFAVLTMSTPLLGCDNAQIDQSDAGADAGTTCSVCPPTANPAKTVINSVIHQNWGRYEAGEICITSNLDDAFIEYKYTLYDQDLIYTYTPTSHRCFNPPPREWNFTPQQVSSYAGTPPKIRKLNLRNGQRIDIRSDYNTGPEAEGFPQECPPTISNEVKSFPTGRLRVTTDIASAPIEITNRDQTLKIETKTDTLLNLEPDGYTIRYLKALGYDKIPLPVTIQVKDGEEQNAPKALYN